MGFIYPTVIVGVRGQWYHQNDHVEFISDEYAPLISKESKADGVGRGCFTHIKHVYHVCRGTQSATPQKNLLWVDLFLVLMQLEDGFIK